MTVKGENSVLEAKNNFKLAFDESDGDYKYHAEIIPDIKNNHIVSITVKENESEGRDYSYVYSQTVNYKYNAKGQVASWSGSATETEVDEGDRYSGSASISCSVQYDAQDRIVKAELQIKGTEDGERFEDTETYTFEYAPGQSNKFYQYTPFLSEFALWDDGYFVQAFAYVGLFGKASSEIPTSVTEFDKYLEDGETYEHSYNYDLSVVLNADGTIRRADGYDYRYTTVETRAASAVPALGKADIKRLLNDRKFKFGSRHGQRR